MTTQNKNVPALRFAEFDGDWEVKKLGEYLTFKNGINAEKSQYGQGKKFINVLDIINNNGILYENIIGKVDVSENELKKNEVKYGDILFQRSSETREEVGQSNVYLDKSQTATFGGFVIRGQAIQEYNPLFFHYLLKTASAREEITTKSGGSTRYNIGQETLKVVNINLPTLPEQQKIAAFLTAVDEKIQQLAKKKELLEQYKKGVMQKIFNQEIRFKDGNGNNFADWEVQKLGNLLIETSERTIETNQFEILSSTNKGLFRQRDYFNKEIASKDNTGYKILRKNQLVFSPQNLWMGNINLNTEFEIGVVSPSYKIFQINKELAEVFYLKYFLMTPKMMYEYAQASEQGASIVRRNLDIGSFNNIKINLPSVREQQKIADFFSAIDDKINFVNQQLEKTRRYKKGLLQQMFV